MERELGVSKSSTGTKRLRMLCSDLVSPSAPYIMPSKVPLMLYSLVYKDTRYGPPLLVMASTIPRGIPIRNVCGLGLEKPTPPAPPPGQSARVN